MSAAALPPAGGTGPRACADETRRNFAAIRRDVVRLYSLMVALIVAVVAWNILQERIDRKQEAMAQSRSLSRALVEHTARILDGSTQYLFDLRHAIEGEGGLEAVDGERLMRLLESRRLHDQSTRRVFVLDRFGQKRRGTTPNARNSAEREYFEHHSTSADRGAKLSFPVATRSDGERVIPLSVRLDNPDGSFGGVALVSIEVSYLLRFYESLQIAHGGSVTLLAPDGRFVLRWPDNAAAVGKRLTEELAHTVQSDENQTSGVSPVDGKMRLVTTRRVSGYPLFVVVGLDEDKVLEAWRREAIVKSFAAVALIVLFTVFTLLLLRRLENERDATNQLAHFRAAIDHAVDLVYWIDASARVVYMNDSALRRLGLARNAKPRLREICAGFNEERWKWVWGQLTEQRELRYECEQVTSAGERFPVELSASSVDVAGNGLALFIGRELTEQKRKDAEILRLNGTLEQSVRERTAELASANAELEAFSYSVSHDLRAPLRHLSGFAAILKRDFAASAPQLKAAETLLDRIAERSDYMNNLVDSLLALSRISRAPLQLERVDLGDMARELFDELALTDPARKAELVIHPDLVTRGDRVLVRTLMQNLIGNAWKYSSRRASARIEIGRSADGAFFVRDNGEGFDPQYSGKLFGAFQRLHSASEFPGTGVGLATARRVVMRHGGRIWAHGRIDAGATFYFTLGAESAAAA